VRGGGSDADANPAVKGSNIERVKVVIELAREWVQLDFAEVTGL
jgi:hypothetical protein